MASSDKGEKRLLQIGGIAGILSGILALLFIPVSPPGLGFVTEENLRLLVQNKTRVVVAVSLEFIGALLLIPLFLALYRSLKEARVGYAMLGSVLGVLGATMSVIAATQEGSTLFLAELYDKASGADKQTVFTIAQASSMSGGGFFVTSNLFVAIALIAIGGAMLGSLTFGRRYAWISSIFGILLAGGLFLVIGFSSFIGFLFFILAFTVWPILIGLKVYRLSKAA